MRLGDIHANPLPTGYGIQLTWSIPAGAEFPGVRAVRRSGTHPTSPTDGVIVAEGIGLQDAADVGLTSETSYYYTLFPYKESPREYAIDRRNRIIALATGRYGMAENLYARLPAIYHRHDQLSPAPGSVDPQDADKGQLRRFLELPGTQLDIMSSLARAIPSFRNIRTAPGTVLPALANWIGWKTDTLLEVDSQRNELRNAPATYQAIGLVPTVEATVKRMSGWESTTKEFVYNVYRSNQPERLNLWIKPSPDGADWTPDAQLLSTDYAFEGRPATTVLVDTTWLFYHTERNGRWDIWYKTRALGGDWMPSERLTKRSLIDKYPSAAVVANTLWIFWSTYDPAATSWRINFRTRVADIWSDPEVFGPTPAEQLLDRKAPIALIAGGELWLFWLERINGRWQLRYNRHDGAAWGAAVSFPLDAGDDPRVETNPAVVFQDIPGDPRLFVFWSRKTDGPATNQTRSEIAYRVKTNLNPDVTGWSNVRTFAKPPLAEFHDKEPAVLINQSDELQLFLSSDRGSQGWSIFQTRMTAFDADLIIGVDAWDVTQRVTAGTYSQHDPEPLVLGTGMLLIYRSSERLVRDSSVYGATRLVDDRYAGSSTASVRYQDMIEQRLSLDDHQTYTYDTGVDGRRNDEDWYSRDTVGVYLDNSTMDEVEIETRINRLRSVLGDFMPATDRAVFISRSDTHVERVYHYGLPPAADSRTIISTYQDELNSVLLEPVFGPGTGITVEFA